MTPWLPVLIARLRNHKLLVAVIAFGLVSLAAFTWGVWQDYADRAVEHDSEPVFWSISFFATWLYNASSNWQSEALVGILVVYLLKRKADEPV